MIFTKKDFKIEIIKSEMNNLKPNINKIKKYINNVSKYAQKILEDNPDMDEEELAETISFNLEEIFKEYLQLADIKGKLFSLEVAKYLNKNNNEFKEIFDKLNQENDLSYANTKYYDEYFERSKYLYTASILDSFRDFKYEIYEEDEISEKEKEIIRNEITFGDLKKWSESFEEAIEEELNEHQVKSIELMGKFFDMFGLLEEYKNNEERKMRYLWLDDIEYPIETGEYSMEKAGIKDTFKKDFLNKLNSDQINLLNVFWKNRFAKEVQSINITLFAINNLNLWKKIKNNKNITVDDQVLQTICLKKQVIDKIYRKSFKEARKYVEKLKQDGTMEEHSKKNGYVMIPQEKVIDKLDKEIGKLYKDYFSKISPELENNFREDYVSTMILENEKQEIYIIKDSILGNLVRDLVNNKRIKNWGYISEKEKLQNVKDKQSIIIGIDIEGFNMPIRLHIDKDIIIEYLNGIGTKSILPIYEGEEDFFFRGKLLKTSLLMPITKKHSDYIKSKIETTSIEKRNIFEHILFLKDSDKYPNHLKEQKIIKGKEKFVRPERRYIDLNSGKIYKKTNKEFIEFDDNSDFDR